MKKLFAGHASSERLHAEIMGHIRANPDEPVSRIERMDSRGKTHAFFVLRVDQDAAQDDIHSNVVMTYALNGPGEISTEHVRALFPITPQQSEVAPALINGLSISELAKELRISIHTAHSHVAALFRKLRSCSRSQLTRTIIREVIAIGATIDAGISVRRPPGRRRLSE